MKTNAAAKLTDLITLDNSTDWEAPNTAAAKRMLKIHLSFSFPLPLVNPLT